MFANQSIPTLEEYLMVAKETNKSVLFDIYFDLPPGARHPHAGFYGQRVVDVILRSGINNSQVMQHSEGTVSWDTLHLHKGSRSTEFDSQILLT